MQIVAGSTFLYGPDGARYKRQDRVAGGTLSRTVRYVGAIEREEYPSGERRIRHTIGGFLLLNREFAHSNPGTQPTVFHNYVYTDHLGSTDVIVSAAGTIVEDLSFDAHGSRRIPGSWTQPLASYIPTTTLRGFTGHEHLDDLGLIHMNARIYDPRLGRFLQADSQIEPDATQGLNRYTYVLNNPLSASDPTGHQSEWVDAAKGIAAIAVSVWLPGSTTLFGAYANSFGAYVFSGFVGGSITGGLQGGLWGAFSASIFYGIGNSFAPYEKAARGIKQLGDAARLAKIVSHGLAGGAINMLRGGKFGHGFISAAATEASSPALEHFNDFGQVVGGALVGGTVSAVTGGKFGNGAITGAFQMAFNEIAHANFMSHKFAEMTAQGPRTVEWVGDGNPASEDIDALAVVNKSLHDAFEAIVSARDFGSMLVYRNAKLTYTATNDGYFAEGKLSHPFQGRINFSRSALDYGSEGLPLAFDYHGTRLAMGGRGSALFATLHEISHLNNFCCAYNSNLGTGPIEAAANSNAMSLLRYANPNIDVSKVRPRP